MAISATPNSGPLRSGCLVAENCLDRSPHSVVPEPPTIGSGVPHQVGPRRPRRLWWLRRRPRRRGSPRSPADQAARPNLIRASRTLPVVAVIRVQVVAPAWIPRITGAPVRVRRGRRRRVGDAGSEEPHTHKHARAQPNPRCRSLGSSHVPIVARLMPIPQRFGAPNSFQPSGIVVPRFHGRLHRAGWPPSVRVARCSRSDKNRTGEFLFRCAQHSG